MKKIYALVKVGRKCSKTEKSTKRSYYVTMIITGIVVAGFMGLIGCGSGIMMPEISRNLPEAYAPTIMFSLVFFFTATIVLFVSIPSLLRSLFLSSDIEMLAAFPLTGAQIGFSRVCSVALLPFLTSCVIIVPFTAGFFMVSGIDVLISIVAVVAVFIIPLGSVCISSAILTLVMKALHRVRNKDVLTVLGVAISIVLVIAYYSVLPVVVSGDTPFDQITVFLTNSWKTTWFIPFSACLALTLSGGPLYLFAAIAIVAALVVLLRFFFLYLYINVALDMANTRSQPKKLESNALARQCVMREKNRAFFLKEIKQYFKETTCLGSWIFASLFPLILVFFNSGMAQGEKGIFTLVGILIKLSQLDPACSVVFGIPLTIAILFMASSMSSAGFSAFSREGEGFDFMKTIPVDYQVQIDAKRKVAMIPMAIAIVLYFVGITAVCAFNGCFPVVFLLTILVTSVFVITILANIQMRTAARNANIHWSNIQTAIKPSMAWLLPGSLMVCLLTAPFFQGQYLLLLERVDFVALLYGVAAFALVLLAFLAIVTTKPCLRYAAHKIKDLV